jgi:hypothetical protein
MFKSRVIRTMIVTTVAALSTLLTGAGASAASTDTTPPTAPLWGYAEGFYCHTLIVGVVESRDNVTPQSSIRYQVFDDGAFIGSLVDNGSGPWGVLVLNKTGPNTVTVRAIDAAGNRSAPSRPVVVTGYYTPGCTPYHF